MVGSTGEGRDWGKADLEGRPICATGSWGGGATEKGQGCRRDRSRSQGLTCAAGNRTRTPRSQCPFKGQRRDNLPITSGWMTVKRPGHVGPWGSEG